MIRFLERSTNRSAAVRLKVSARCGSAANQARRSGVKLAFFSVRPAQAEVVVASTNALM